MIFHKTYPYLLQFSYTTHSINYVLCIHVFIFHFAQWCTYYYFSTRSWHSPGRPFITVFIHPCMEILSRSIQNALDYNSWHPITLSPNAPPISYLFFADDIILASCTTPTSCATIINTLRHFSEWPGMKINLAKSKKKKNLK